MTHEPSAENLSRSDMPMSTPPPVALRNCYALSNAASCCRRSSGRDRRRFTCWDGNERLRSNRRASEAIQAPPSPRAEGLNAPGLISIPHLAGDAIGRSGDTRAPRSGRVCRHPGPCRRTIGETPKCVPRTWIGPPSCGFPSGGSLHGRSSSPAPILWACPRPGAVSARLWASRGCPCRRAHLGDCRRRTPSRWKARFPSRCPTPCFGWSSRTGTRCWLTSRERCGCTTSGSSRGIGSWWSCRRTI